MAFQERQHRETVERLRREEPVESMESEYAVHTFEPRRVRVAMLADTTLAGGGGPAGGGTIAAERRNFGPPQTSMQAYLSRQMPPPMNVQPLVAPALQAKASVEQGLAALSFVAEPVSAPLELPAETLEAQGLGASIRRPAEAAAVPAQPRRNEAIVNLIRGAKDRIAATPADKPIEISAEQIEPLRLGTPAPRPEPVQKPSDSPNNAPSSGARIRSIAITVPPGSTGAPASPVTSQAPQMVGRPTVHATQPRSRAAEQPRSRAVEQPAGGLPAARVLTPSFSSFGDGLANTTDGGRSRWIAGAVAAGIATCGIAYFLFA